MQSEENLPRALSWEEANRVWAVQDYVADHPTAGDDTRASARAWHKAIATVTEYEGWTISRYRQRHKQ